MDKNIKNKNKLLSDKYSKGINFGNKYKIWWI